MHNSNNVLTYTHFFVATHQRKLLSWFERHKIIGGIARGILYLHEHSRLKVIHREYMSPEYAMFGHYSRIMECL